MILLALLLLGAIWWVSVVLWTVPTLISTGVVLLVEVAAIGVWRIRDRRDWPRARAWRRSR